MITIKPLKYEYCEQVYEIAKAYLPEHWSLDGVRDVLKYDNNIYYVAIDSDSENENDDSINIVGFGGIMTVADEAELLNIAVDETVRREGVASIIMDHLINDAKTRDCFRMLLEVRSQNDAARHLYKKLGFEELAVRKGYYSNPADDAVIMERML